MFDVEVFDLKWTRHAPLGARGTGLRWSAATATHRYWVHQLLDGAILRVTVVGTHEVVHVCRHAAVDDAVDHAIAIHGSRPLTAMHHVTVVA